MKKRILSVVILLVFATVTAFAAAAAPVKGTIASIDGTKVQITLVGERADWVKKGSGVKFKGGNGKITEVTATTMTITTKKASDLKVGETLTLDKAAIMSGC